MHVSPHLYPTGRQLPLVTVALILALATGAAAEPEPVLRLPGSAARRLDAEPGDTTPVYVLHTGRETLEWDPGAVAAGVYTFGMTVRCGSDDADPLNLVSRYRLQAVTADGGEGPAVAFRPAPGSRPEKTSKEWPHYVADIVGDAPLELRPGTRLRVTCPAAWAEVREIRLFPAPDRDRLACRLAADAPHSLFRRGEPVRVHATLRSFWDAPVTVTCRLELVSPYGRTVQEKSEPVTVPAMGTVPLPWAPAATLTGCHTVRLTAACTPPGKPAFEYTDEVSVGVVAAPTADRVATESPFGVHPAGLREMYQSGFRWVRLWDTGDVWAAHEREGKGRFDFRATEEKVDNFRRAGFEVLAVLAYAPTWASTHPEIGYYTGAGSPFPPKDIGDWRDYCREYMTRFRGRIRHFEVWNEPNTGSVGNLQSGFFRGTVDDYVLLLKTAFEVAREVDPAIRIVGGSGTGDFLAWTEAVLANGGGPFMHLLSFHAYTTPSSPEEANLEGRLERLHQIMASHGVANLPLWNTEVGYWQDRRVGARPATAAELLAKAPPGLAPNWTADWPYRPIPEDDAAAYTVRHFYLNLAHGVDKLFWYSSAPSGLPLLCDDGSLRLPAFAVAAAATELDGLAYARRIDLGLKRLHLHLWQGRDVVKAVAWHADPSTRDILLQPGAAPLAAVDLWGNPVDLARTPEGVLLTAGRDPVTLTATAAVFDSARLRARDITIPVTDCRVVHEANPERPVRNHTSPLYHGDRQVFGLPDKGDAIGWKLTGIRPGLYQVEIELRTGDAANLYGCLPWYRVEAVTGDRREPLTLVPVDDPARRPQAITTAEGGNRAYGWARAEAPLTLEPATGIQLTLQDGFGFVGALALREATAEARVFSLPSLAAAPVLDGQLDEVRNLPPLDLRAKRQVAIGVADPFASTSEHDAWRGPDDLSARCWLARTTAGDALYAAVEVTDGGADRLFPSEAAPFSGDCVELFLDLRPTPDLGSPVLAEGAYQLMLRAPAGQEPETRLAARPLPGARALARRTATGWCAEFALPVPVLAPGRLLGFDLAVDDDDTGAGRKSQIVWHGTRENFQDPSAYGRFRLP